MTANPRKSRQPKTVQLPSGYRAVYRELGSGPAVVFLHGLLGNHRHWLGVMQKLSRNHHCIGIDLLGFGGSSQPAIDYSIALEVAFVRDVIAEIGLTDYALVGHSLGGWIAATYALRYSSALSHLILVAPAGIGPLHRHDRRLRALAWPHPIVDRGLSALAKLTRKTGLSSDDIDALTITRQAILSQPIARQWLRQRQQQSRESQVNSPFRDETIANAIHQISTPTLIIAADRDRTIPHWHCQTYCDRIPNARLLTLPHTDHRLPLDHWRQMWPHIATFLKDD